MSTIRLLDRDCAMPARPIPNAPIAVAPDETGREWTGPVPGAVRKSLSRRPTCPVCGIACRDEKAAEACCQTPDPGEGATFAKVLELRCKGLLAQEIAPALGTSFQNIVPLVRAADDALCRKYGLSLHHLEKWRHARRAENAQKCP